MLSQTNLHQSKKFSKKAIELGLSMDMDLAIAKLNLAWISMTRMHKMETITLLKVSKKLDKQGILSD